MEGVAWYIVACAAVFGALAGVAAGRLAWRCMRRRGFEGAWSRRRDVLAGGVCALVYAGIAVRYGPTLEAAQLACFAAVLLASSVTDLGCRIIPDSCIAASIAVRAAYIALAGLLCGADAAQLALDALFGATVLFAGLAVFTLLADRVIGGSNMGGGDLKLFFVVGLYFGWERGIAVVALSSVLGLAGYGIAALHGKRSEHDATMPFGPAIALSSWAAMLAL